MKLQGSNNDFLCVWSGDFLPQAAEESWDRVRVTCSQPFNKRNQFGLSFFRVRTTVEHTEESSANQINPTTKNQARLFIYSSGDNAMVYLQGSKKQHFLH